jgi:polar amino acid transport system substrate-binding protein
LLHIRWVDLASTLCLNLNLKFHRRRNVKRLSIIVIAVMLVSVVLTACGGAAAPTTIKIGTDATFPPFELVDEKTKELTGFDVELMKAVAQKAGLVVEFTNVGFDPLLAGIAQCQYDGGIAAITITDERKQQMKFSDPYFDAGQVVVVQKGNDAIKSKDDLSGKTVGSQIGTTGAIEVGKISGAKLKTYDSFDLAFQDLINGQIDAVIADNPLALGYIGKNADKIKVVGPVFTSESYGIALCNKKADLVDKLNKGIAAVKADGTLDKLTQKWIVGSGQ